MRTFTSRFVVLLACTGALGCDDGEPCTSSPAKTTLQVVDSLDNPVPIESVSLRQGDYETTCMDVRPRDGVATCLVSHAGPATFVVHAQGRTLMHEIEVLEWSEPGTCMLVPPQEGTTLVYDGPRCELGTLEVARGELIERDGSPAERAKVEIRTEGARADCGIEGSHFSCPALLSSETRYDVTATIGSSRLTQTVDVAVQECSVPSPADLIFDRSMWPCNEEPKPAARVYVTVWDAQIGQQRKVIADSVRIHRGELSVQDCVLEPPSDKPAPRAFVCPTLSATGGGTYTFEVSYAGQSKTSDLIFVYDNGCQPESTTNVSIQFP